MSSEISNPFSTGGGGQSFEAKVQASFLLHLLIGGRVPCLPSGKVETVRLQAKQAGFNTDDIVIKICTDEGVNHRLLVQIKHHVTITASDEEFKSALKSAWSDFNNQSLFVQGRDALALITGPLSEQTLQHVRPLLDWARTSETSEEFFKKVATAQFSSDKKRGYLQVFRDVLTKITQVSPADELVWKFLQHFYLLSYDFDVQGGKDESSILTVLDLSRNSTNSLDAQAIWDGLVVQAQEWNKTAGTFTHPHFSERIRLAVQPQRSTTQQEAVSKLKEHCDFILGSISTEVAPAVKLSRVTILDTLASAIESSRIIIVQGAPGSGKSAVVKMLLEALPNGIIPFAFKAQEFNQPHIHQFLSSIGIHLTLAQLRCEFGLLPRKILLVDGAERLFELSSHEAFRHLVQQLNDDPSWTVVITCRESSTQELREHLLAQWGTDVTPITVPPLSSEELAWISTKAPQLSPLIANQRLTKLLSLPFILSLAWRAFPIPTSAETASNVDEVQFNDIVWKGYIERAGDAPRVLQSKRGQCLISVSVERARQMSLFVPPRDRDVNALNALTDDGILIKSQSGSYAPAHDVLEDWAVSRFIAQEFDSKAGSPSQFVESIGTEPAMRRNFRLWLSESLKAADNQNVIDFVSFSFQSTSLPPVWRDEIAVAVLQSENASEFIQRVERLLLSNDKTHYKQLAHILRTACKGPNESLLRNLGLATFRNHIALQSVFVVPSGSGWRELILFTHRNLAAFDLRDVNTILRLLKDWSQGVGFSDPLPSESEAVAQICFKYWELLTVPDLYAGELAQEFLQLLFKIPQAAPTQIESLIRSAMANDIAHEHQSRVVLEHGVKSIECQPLCTHFPNLVIEIAKKIWTSRPEEDRFSSRLDIGDLFGLGGLGHSDYFPESALQGPFLFLFASHPEAALDFVVQLTNAATATYSQSALGSEVHNITLLTQAGSRSLLASPRLWVLYRGMMPAPNVLECALMAMEAWLLGQAKQGKDVQKAARIIFDTSTSVATIAVLASLAIAYPKALGDEALSLLQAKEFYQWDFERSIQEKSRPVDARSMMGIPTGGIDNFYYQERKTQADLPHRTNNLEHLAVRLQSTPLREKIWELLDGFQKSLLPEKKQSKRDKSWRIALHRMDTRHFKVSPSDEPNEVMLIPGEPEPDLKKYIENAQADYAPTEARVRLANWGMAKFRRELQAHDAFPNWKDALREAQDLWEKNGTVAIEASLGISGPSFVAAVLVRDYYTELEPKDLAWCRQALIKEVLMKDSERTWNTHISKDPFYGSRPSAFVLPLLLRGTVDESTRNQIEDCLAVAVTHTSDEVRNYAAAGIRDWLWDHDPELAKSCVSGLFELAATQNQIRRDQRKQRNFSHENEEKAIWESIRDIRVRIVKRQTTSILKSPTVNLEIHDWPELLDALSMLKPEIRDPQLKAFVMACLNALVLEAEAAEAWKADDRCHYEFQYPFAKLFASFVLAQPLEEAEQIGIFLSGYVERCPKYLSVLLEKLPYEEDRVYSNRIFWSIWKKVSEPIFAHHLLRGSTRIWRYSQVHQLVRILLFANMEWKKGVKEWRSVTENRDFFERAISTVGNTKAGFGALLSLLCSVGQVFLPDIIIPFAQTFEHAEGRDLLDETNSIFDLEVLLRKICYEFDTEVKKRPELHRAVLTLLDKLVEHGSHTGFRLRDYMVTPLPLTA